MRIIFADTFYWIALLSPGDQWYQTALAYGKQHPTISLVVTDGILDEILTDVTRNPYLL
jgi:predicted nucleic acid-binding protein